MHCCHTGGEPTRRATVAERPRRITTLVQWAIPLTTLVFIPKCPLCLAGYVLLFTGIGLSVPVAAALRWTFIALSVVALAYLFFRAVRRTLASR